MAIEFHEPPYSSGGYTEVKENGETIGNIHQYHTGGAGIARSEICHVHQWSEVTHWESNEEFPGEKAPKHWETEHDK